MNLKTKSVCIYDKGQFLNLAPRLVKDFGEVMYFNPAWKTQAPEIGLSKIGDGITDVQHIQDFWGHIADTDLFIFPDNLDGDIQTYLREQGKYVFGSGYADELETDRLTAKYYCRELGIPIGEFEEVTGITNLRKYIKEHKRTWVKIDAYRGSMESFFAKNFAYIEAKLNQVQYQLGAAAETTIFDCEKELKDLVEIGYDGTCIDGQYPTKTCFGIEVKDSAYVGVFTDYSKLPKQVTLVNEKLASDLKKYQCKNIIGTEVRVNKEIGYLMDLSIRFTSPPSEGLQKMFTNLSDMMWQGAQGICIDPIPENKYLVQLIMNCEFADDTTYNIQFPEKYKNNIKLKNYHIINGKYQIEPQPIPLSEIGCVVETGNSLSDCFESIGEICDQIDGFFLEFPKDALKKAEEEIEKLKDMGIDLF